MSLLRYTTGAQGITGATGATGQRRASDNRTTTQRPCDGPLGKQLKTRTLLHRLLHGRCLITLISAMLCTRAIIILMPTMYG